MTIMALLLAVAGPGASGFIASAFPETLAGAVISGTDRALGPTTVTPSGGTGTYTYAWTVLESDYSTVINSPTSATTTITMECPFGEVGAAIARCTVTDTGSGLTAIADVSLSVSRFV